jgi:ligand-binding sensor domain-containing protein
MSLYGNGLAKYDGRKFTYYNKSNGLLNNSIRTIYIDEDTNLIFLGTEEGLSIFDGHRFYNHKLKIRNRLGRFQVNFIAKYGAKYILGVNQEYLYELVLNKKAPGKSRLIRFYNPKTFNYSGWIKGNSFLNTNISNEFEVHDLRTKTKTSYGSFPLIWDFVTDDQNNILMACWAVHTPTGGIYSYFNRKLVDLSQKWNLTSRQFWCLYFDSTTKQLWAGSIDKGVFVIQLNSEVKYHTSSEFGINDLEAHSLLFDKQGKFWVGGVNFILHKTQNRIRSIDNIQLKKKLKAYIKNTEWDQYYDLKYQLKNTKDFICHSLKQDPSGRVWALTTFGLICFDEEFKITRFHFYRETGGVFDFIDAHRYILCNIYNLSFLNNIESKGIERKFIRLNGKQISLDATQTVSTKNGLWIGSYSKGLLLYRNGKISSMKDLGYLDEHYITDVCVVDDQQILAGSISGYLYLLKWNNERLKIEKTFKPDKQLQGSSIFFIRKWKNYWLVATNKGLNILKNGRPFKFLDDSENFELATYFDAKIDDKRQRLWIAYSKGLISYNLTKLGRIESVNSRLYITDIFINQERRKTTVPLNLKHNENNIEVAFVSNNTFNPTKNRYRYKIQGLSDNWSSFSSENVLKLFGLKSGDFKLIIEGKNIGTGAKINPITLAIHVSPPFWKTLWFIGGLVLILFVVGYYLIRRKIKSIETYERLQKSIAETKLKALQSQMNPHFTFNAINSIQNFVLDNNMDSALSYIGEFSKLIRLTLEFSAKKSVSLQEEIDFLKIYIDLENLRRRSKVVYSIHLENELDAEEIYISPLLIQPIIENVFVHAFASQTVNPNLDIHFTLQEQFLLCTIEDNGVGMVLEEFQNKKSKGLQLIKERLELMNGLVSKSIEISSVTGQGTKVKLYFSLR